MRAGLTASPKQLPPVYFYDDRGSRLFDEITRLPEYYPTRAERSILEAHAKDMVAGAGADVLVELGAGTCDKTRVLLDAMRDSGRLGTYIPLDVSDTTLWAAATALSEEYPGLAVRAVVGDFHAHLDHLDARRASACSPSSAGPSGTSPPTSGRRSWPAWSTCARATACCSAPTWSRTGRGSSPPTTTPPGSTAEFNRNVLHVLNRDLGADFDPGPLRPRGPVERARAPHRDVAPVRRRLPGPRRRPRPRGRVRRRRGDADRAQHQVLHRGTARRARGGRPGGRGLMGGRRRRVRPDPGRRP